MSGSLRDAVRLDLTDKDLFERENEIKILQDSLERITHDERMELLTSFCRCVLWNGRGATGSSSHIWSYSASGGIVAAG